jgi:hypothetical protein
MKHLFDVLMLGILMIYAFDGGSAFARGSGHSRGGGHHGHSARSSGFAMRPFYAAPLSAHPTQRYCLSNGRYYIDPRDCPPATVQPQTSSANDVRPEFTYE